MIEIFEGLPGGGKSYAAVSTRILPWLRRGRRVWVLFEGISLAKWAALTDLGEDRLSESLRPIDRKDVFSLPSLVSLNDAIVIDESQMVLRAGEKPPKEFVEFLERHRHFGLDIVLVCQRWDQLPAVVTRLVEVTTCFRKMGYLGVSSRYQARVRGCPGEKVIMRSFVGKYDPRIYSLYRSYESDKVIEQSSRSTVWKSFPVVGAAIVLLVVGVWWFRRPSWTALAEPVSAASPAGGVSAPSSVPPTWELLENQPGRLAGASASSVVRVRLVGTVCMWAPGRDCLYINSDGELLTASDLVAQTGVPLVEVSDRWGRLRLQGEGVEYATVGSSVDGSSHSGDGGVFSSGSGRGPDY